MSSLGRLCCAAIAMLTLGTVFSDSYSVSAQLIISEFRVRGPNGANDEFIELYNNSGADHTVSSAGPSTGYAVAASNGVARCVVPNGTVIPNRGHYLCVTRSLLSASYPSGTARPRRGPTYPRHPRQRGHRHFTLSMRATSRSPTASTPSARLPRPTRSTRRGLATPR